MATLDDRSYSAVFSGLKSTAITAGIFFVAGCTLHETFKRLRRYPDEDKARARGENVPDRGMEGWAMGYLYRARTYVEGERAPDFANYPLSWIVEAVRRKMSYFEEHDIGADAVVYLRFLRGTFYWTMFLLCTVFPILISINFIYSPSEIPTNNINRASIASLVLSGKGIRLLGVHVACVWIVSCSWFLTLFWIGRGAIRVRQNELRRILADETQETHKSSTRLPPREIDPSIAPEDVGWRYRTVLVRNIPPSLRTERAISDYFEHHFRTNRSESQDSTTTSTPAEHKDSFAKTSAPEKSRLITEIVLVRRQAELNALYAKYIEVLHELETAHVQLARNVMNWVATQVKDEELASQGQLPPLTPYEWVKLQLSNKSREAYNLKHAARATDVIIVSSLRPFLNGERRPIDQQGAPVSIWAVLHKLQHEHANLLDRFHPIKRLSRFRGQAVPAIDYWLTKLNIQMSLIDDLRARPERFEAASTAFVTFERVEDSLRVRRELGGRHLRAKTIRHGGKALEFRVKPAPEARDLHWDQLVVVSLHADLLRGTILQVVIWTMTIVWVVPISFLIGLFSLESLTVRLPGLANFLRNNTTLNTLFSSLLPTALMAVLNMFVPTVLGILQRKGKTIITESKWSAQTQSAYHKFLIINFIVVFCIGISAFTAFLNAFRQPVSVLTVVAGAFPKGATFFVSWSLLIVGLQSGLEISLFGISWINHNSIRKYIAPRKREIDAVPRFFGWQNWVPTHLLIISVSLLFACLNPLVIAFNFAYFAVSFTVFKNQFAHVYYRRHFEGGGRTIYRRIFRYSLDMAIFSQFVLVAFFWVLKKFSLGGACIPLIPITVLLKLVGTRYFDHRMDEIEDAHAKAVCGVIEPDRGLSVPLQTDEELSHGKHRSVLEALASIKTFATVTAPSLLLRPTAKLPFVGERFEMQHMRRRPASESAAQRSRNRVPSNLSRARASTSPDDQRRPILLETIMSRASTAQETPAIGSHSPAIGSNSPVIGSVSPAPASAPTLPVIQTSVFSTDTKEPSSLPQNSSLVSPHAPVLRDDRPVSHVHYDNPAAVTPLSRSLWLPRDPLKPVDLGDTVNYNGRALVSSEGGDGLIGSFEAFECLSEEESDEDEELDQDNLQRAQRSNSLAPPSPHSPTLSRKLSRGTSRASVDHGLTLKGNERIRVAADVAQKIAAEGGSPVVAATSGTSDHLSIISGGIRRRRSTQTSIASFALPSPQHSPVLRRSPHEPRPSPPAIPVFTQEPQTDASTLSPPASAPAEQTAFPFPPGSPRATSPTRKSRRLTVSSLSPPSSRIGIGSPPLGSSTSRRRSTRTNRSNSIAPSIQHSITLSRIDEPGTTIGGGEGEEGEEQEVISQAAALRAELLHEEILAHQRHVKQEEKRQEQESKDRHGRSGFLSRLLAKSEQAEEADDT
ncbi:uncharacterized protein JCM15063_001498 [Sporobolomyces koalae]|uniref:uncharacterized protein n=1 Tax=Sporobolomyces koalae TaxID=500713 RepID=UPI003178EDCF